MKPDDLVQVPYWKQTPFIWNTGIIVRLNSLGTHWIVYIIIKDIIIPYEPFEIKKLK